MEKYDIVIGLEVHVQLNTLSKAFCGDAVIFGSEPNTLISAISLGHPGTLPRANDAQVNSAITLGLALGSKINRLNQFDRKNYFYTDLPKGYQITQDESPICIGGALPLYSLNDGKKTIEIHHIHMEEDAGKSIHDLSDTHTFIDLNRAGTPLLEIVTEPVLSSADEVDAFMSGIRQLVRWLGISDGNMEQGSLRCDVNISLKPSGSSVFGNRCEIKNMNSMRFARKAISYEIERQAKILDSGKEVLQETRKFHPETNTTSSLRSKEDAHDYRYFPDPDLPPILIEESKIKELESQMELLPWDAYSAFSEEGVSSKDAILLTKSKALACFAKAAIKSSRYPKLMATLIINYLLPYLQKSETPITNQPFDKKDLELFVSLIGKGELTNHLAYQKLWPAFCKAPKESPQKLADKLGLLEGNDFDLEEIIDKCLLDNEAKVKAYRNGKKGLLGFFMGQLMRQTKGKANPKELETLLKKKLG